MNGKALLTTLICLSIPGAALSQDLPIVQGVEPQPLVAQALRLTDALEYLGSALRPEHAARIRALQREAPSPETSGGDTADSRPLLPGDGRYQSGGAGQGGAGPLLPLSSRRVVGRASSSR